MITKILKTLALSGAFLFSAVSAQAGILPLISGTTSFDCTLGASLGGGSCTTEQVTPHPAWQPVPLADGAVWISYDDTGYGDSVLTPRNGSAENPDGTSVIMTLSKTFYIGAAGGLINLKVWTDDTASVFLTGGAINQAANFTQSTCANGPIGCQPNEAGNFQNIALGEGLYTLSISGYQVGDGTNTTTNPFR